MKYLRKIVLSMIVAIMFVFLICVFWKAHGKSGIPFSTSSGKSIVALMSIMSIDFIVGLINAIFFKKSKKSSHGGLSSQVGTKGIMKKALILILILSIHILEKNTLVLKDFPFLSVAVVSGFLIMEFVSILENLILMGIPFPKKLQRIFEVVRKEELKDKKEKKKEEEEKEDK